MHTIRGDVLIIGGGLAAACAALEAAKYGANVILLDRGKFGSSGSSPLSGGNPQVPPPPDRGGSKSDGPEVLFEDMVAGGEYLSDQKMARVLAFEGLNSVLELEALGVPYRKKPDGSFETFITMGMSRARIGPVLRNGQGLMQALRREVLHRGVTVLERVRVTGLIQDGNGRMAGAFGIGCRGGSMESYLFAAPAIVLAAGSATSLFPVSSSAYRISGDAFALAYRAGARFVNMEFIEFTASPLIGDTPISTSGIKPTLGKGAKFFNRSGERFLEKVDPERLENTTRGKLIRAIYEEMEAGQGPCLMDARSLDTPTAPLRRFSSLTGLDYRHELIPWVPAVHTFLGGIFIDEDGRTGVEGLYAAGESAGNGRVFGADRIGGAVAACQVFGKRAGRAAALEALQARNRGSAIDPARGEREEKQLRGLLGQKGAPAAGALRELQELAWRGIGVKRNGPDLQHARAGFNRLRRSVVQITSTGDLHLALDLENLALTGEMIASCALLRQESRGQHWRDDYPRPAGRDGLVWHIITPGPEGDIQTGAMGLEFPYLSPEGGK